jgi:hypothetical protein
MILSTFSLTPELSKKNIEKNSKIEKQKQKPKHRQKFKNSKTKKKKSPKNSKKKFLTLTLLCQVFLLF